MSLCDGALFATVASYRYTGLPAVDTMTTQYQHSMVFDLRFCDDNRVTLSLDSYDTKLP